MRILILLPLCVFIVAFDATKKSENEGCEKIIVIPPEHEEIDVSRYIVQTWKEEVQRLKLIKDCDQFVPFDQAEKIFFYINIAHDNSISSHDLKESQREFLLREEKLTQAISLQYQLSDQNKMLIMRAKVFDLVKNKPNPKSSLVKTLKISGKHRFSSKLTRKKILRKLSRVFVPTGLSFGLTTSTVYYNSYTEKDKKEYYRFKKTKERQHSFLPPIISSIRLENIVARSGYNMFDFDFRFLSSVSNIYHDTTYNLQPVQPEAAQTLQESESSDLEASEIQYRLIILGIVYSASAEIALYLPLGNLFMSAGLAPILYYAADNFDLEIYSAKLGFQFGAGYRAFFNEQWFFQFCVDALTLQGVVETPYFRSQNRGSVFISIGYFYPELQQIVRRAI